MTSNDSAVKQDALAEAPAKLDKSDLRRAFWRTFCLSGTWNYERQQHMGYCFSMIPTINKLYKKKEDRAKALHRHLEFFNTAQIFSTFIVGSTMAMEEQNANSDNFDDSSISAIKIALMNPLAGIGDSLFRSTLRVLGTGIATSFCMQGSILGPILFLLIYNIPHLIIRWLSVHMGYRLGTNLLSEVQSSGIMEKITYAAAIVGLMCVGGMIFNTVSIATPLAVSGGESVISIQESLDTVFPGLLPLGVTGLFYWLMGKKVSVIWLLLATFVLGIALSAVGILG